MILSADFSSSYLHGFVNVLQNFDLMALDAVIGRVCAAYREGRQLFVAGNGGSAATASHLAADLGKTVLGKRIDPRTRRFRVHALTDNVPMLTAYGNDVSYDEIFAEPLRAWADRGDALLVISASGNSPNVLRTITVARDLGVETIGLLGFEGGAAAPLLDYAFIVRSVHYGYIEDAHSVVMHMLTDALKPLVAASLPTA
ncbi:MAG: SIS domain-containing protein [Chloroflexi bacterium]|nr:SIS domain-containing protein [Chloroflexota bacterium]